MVCMELILGCIKYLTLMLILLMFIWVFIGACLLICFMVLFNWVDGSAKNNPCIRFIKRTLSLFKSKDLNNGQ